MIRFPSLPLLQKGALISPTTLNVIRFQYNPETLTRTLSARTTGNTDTNPRDPLRVQGPPKEDIRVEIFIDATDALEEGSRLAETQGIHPRLAALELLLYPRMARVLWNEAKRRLGVIEVMAPTAPLTLFVWGPQRVLPVRISGMTIVEEAFDPDLRPLVARVTLDMTVHSYYDLGLLSAGGGLFAVHQILKEGLALMDVAWQARPLQAHIPAVKQAANAAGAAISGAARTAGSAISGAANSAGSAVSGAANTVGGAVTSTYTKIPKL
ncbi:MAG: hypothetical protein JNJ46_22605 [Myxococcales bacterium]|nr:hypothetical protein [Myxococcales bacterium]